MDQLLMLTVSPSANEQHPRTIMPSIERLRTALAVRGSSNRHEAVPTSHMQGRVEEN
jgi:hypothetical protein